MKFSTARVSLTSLAGLFAVSTTLGMLGCSAPGDGDGGGPGAGGTTGSGAGAGVTGGSGAGISLGTGSGTGTGIPSDDRDLPVRTKVCDELGNCTCLKLAVLGTLESAADAADTQPFVDWLNTNSGGTAQVTMVNTKPTIDDAWLANYDIIVVANVNGWVFSDAEKAAVQKWSLELGGGIVSLTGFTSTPTEPADTSQLISFSGLSYTATRTSEGGEALPVTYQGGTTNLKSCLVWNPLIGNPQITTPIPFTAQTDEQLAKLTANLSFVGAFIGFGVQAPTDAVVIATDPVSGQPIAAAKEVDGKGRVFAFGDEWVMLANQWGPAPGATPSNQSKDAGNVCYVPAAGDAAEFFHSTATLYQTKQFWYNAISYVAPPNECFVIEDPDVIIIK